MGDTIADRAPETISAVAAAATTLVVTVLVALFVAAVAGLAGAAPGTVQVLVGVVVGGGLLAALGVSAVAWLTVGWTRSVVRSLGRRARTGLLEVTRSVEETVPPARRLELTARVAGDERAQLADLKRRYVAGSVDEREFEREVSRIVDDEARAPDVAEVTAERSTASVEVTDVDREAGGDTERAVEEHPSSDT